MKDIILKKQKSNEPEFGELNKMLADLDEFLSEDANPNDKEWSKNLNAIIDFQNLDGSFKLLDSDEVPIDAKVDFCLTPTYLCTAILMKACLADSKAFSLNEALSKGLEKSCAKGFNGHGFEALKGQIEAINIFMNAGVREFIDIYPEICPEFTQIIGTIVSRFQKWECRGKFTGPWGESYEDEIRAINKYFS